MKVLVSYNIAILRTTFCKLKKQASCKPSRNTFLVLQNSSLFWDSLFLSLLKNVKDEYTTVIRWRIQNETLVCQLALFQLVVALVSVTQHIYSIIVYDTIFACVFDTHDHNVYTSHSLFLSYDVIIFDFHLFAGLLNLKQCIANYMDNGHMRCMWCVTQILSIVSLLCIPCVARPHHRHLWLMMLVQNCYCIGLMFLSIATAQKLLVTLLDFTSFPNDKWFLCVVFLTGTSINYFMNYVLWHLYWHFEQLNKVSACDLVIPHNDMLAYTEEVSDQDDDNSEPDWV